MNDIRGLIITKEYLPSFEWVRDIQYFDGPLLSEYKTNTGDTYIFHWCDCSENLNRWLAVRVSKRSLLELTSGLLSIHEALTVKNQENTSIILDIDDNVDIAEAKLVSISDLPTSYLPKKEVTIDPELFHDYDGSVYPILIDGEWDSDDLSMIQRKFIDIYSLIVNFVDQRKQNFSDHPWKGGFSSVNFFHDMRNALIFKPDIKAIHYASPGYIEFRAKRNISLKIKYNVDKYIINKEEINKYYAELSNYVRDEEFNKMDNVELTPQQENTIKRLGQGLLQHFTDPTWEWLQNKSSSTFKSAKIAKSYCNRIKDLASFIEDNRAMFAEI